MANLAPDDRARAEQVFVCDMGARTTTLISFSGDGKGNDDSQSLSLIGRRPLVAFVSSATNLVPNAPGGVFIKEVAVAPLPYAS